MVEIVEHTADMGLRAAAGSLGELFAEAARGLYLLILEDPGTVEVRQSTTIALAAGSLDDLFFDWLSELLYLFDARHLVLSRFDVRVEGMQLQAEVGGEILDPDRHRVAREVKAVTYHHLEVKQTPAGGWEATVIVDI
jgi:SHS2 domain-containing protein